MCVAFFTGRVEIAMCGRYTLTADLKKVTDRFCAPMPGDGWATCAPPRYNVAPYAGGGLLEKFDNLVPVRN